MSDDAAALLELVGKAVGEAAEAAGLPGRAVAGFDGGAKRWAWAEHSPEGWVAEVVLSCPLDPLERGAPVGVFAVARGPERGHSWSALVWARHLDRDPARLCAFEEELPARLREAFAKARSVAPELGDLPERKRERLREMVREHAHLFREGTR